MAKIVITIEDLPNGKVKTSCDPNFDTMIRMHISGTPFTAAHGYALAALNKIVEESKKNCPTRILIPRVGK
ncbi:MAG: hypothetical protein A4E53_01684 [Pelotomaculum sp. PtaB.Bin104]|jgi:hypothetical protein|nr:MAG: hypothetical protein A4E53_01684 [Pelotomaculum sp. PtaB.Bin104]